MLILQAQEEERRRLALELHDESSQNLTALLIHIEILSQSLQALPDTTMANDARKQLEGELQYLAGLSQHTLENIRTLAQELRPGVLDDLGLHAAFRWLAEDGSVVGVLAFGNTTSSERDWLTDEEVTRLATDPAFTLK